MERHGPWNFYFRGSSFIYRGRHDLTHKWIYCQEYVELKEKAPANIRIEICRRNSYDDAKKSWKCFRVKLTEETRMEIK